MQSFVQIKFEVQMIFLFNRKLLVFRVSFHFFFLTFFFLLIKPEKQESQTIQWLIGLSVANLARKLTSPITSFGTKTEWQTTSDWAKLCKSSTKILSCQLGLHILLETKTGLKLSVRNKRNLNPKLLAFTAASTIASRIMRAPKLPPLAYFWLHRQR